MNNKMFKNLAILTSAILITINIDIIPANAEDKNIKQENYKEINLSDNSKISDIEKRVKNEYIIKYKDGIDESEKIKNRTDTNSKLIDETKNGVELLQTSQDKIDLTIEKLKENKNIEYVCPNYIREVNYIPNDKLIEDQWAIDNVNADKAWNIINKTENLSEVKVAVIDTGIDVSHEDLQGKISSDGYDFVNNDNDPRNDSIFEEHGTHVAGIIAAKSNNNLGISGFTGNAPVKIMPVKVLDNGSGNDFTVSKGIYYAADNGADIINLSLDGFGYSKLLSESVNYALEKGIIVVASAGNESMNTNVFRPASIPGVITVSGTNIENNLTSFTNYGNEVDIAAPAESIISTIPGNNYEMFDGNSMATPIVSSAIAIIKSVNPKYSATQIEDILYNSAKDMADEGRDKYYGYGLVDFEKALKTKPSDNKVKIQDISNKKRVFYKTDVNFKYSTPETLKNIDIYLDDKLIKKISDNLNKAILGSEINIESYENGIKKLKVVATDIDGSLYEDSIDINIVNEVTSGARVKISDDGLAVSNCYVTVLGDIPNENSEKDKKNDSETFLTKKFVGITDINGYVDLSQNDLGDLKNYIVYVEYREYKDENKDLKPDKIIYNNHIKEMNGSGLIELDNKNLITPKYINKIKGAKYVLVDGNYKLNNGKYLNIAQIALANSEIETSMIDVNITEGTYKANLQAESYINDKLDKIYNLSQDISLTNENKNIDFNFKKTTQIKESFTGIKDIKTSATYGISDGEGNSWGMRNTDNPDGLTFVVNNGKYIPIIFINYIKDNYEYEMTFEGNEKIFRCNKSYVHKFGGDFRKTKVKLDKKNYNKSDDMIIAPKIEDQYKNKLTNAWSLGEAIQYESNDVLSIKKLIKNGHILKSVSWNNNLKKFEVDEIKTTNIMEMLIIDKQGDIIQEEKFDICEKFTNILPDDIEKGTYEIQLFTKCPYDEISKARFKIEK